MMGGGGGRRTTPGPHPGGGGGGGGATPIFRPPRSHSRCGDESVGLPGVRRKPRPRDVVLGQRERPTFVDLYRRGSGQYAAKLESCGVVDLKLCFDDKPSSSLTYSALVGGPLHEAPGSVFISVRRNVHRYSNHLYVEFPLRLPLQVSRRKLCCPRIARFDRDDPFVRPADAALIWGSFADVAHPEPGATPPPSSEYFAGWLGRPY